MKKRSAREVYRRQQETIIWLEQTGSGDLSSQFGVPAENQRERDGRTGKGAARTQKELEKD